MVKKLFWYVIIQMPTCRYQFNFTPAHFPPIIHGALLSPLLLSCFFAFTSLLLQRPATPFLVVVDGSSVNSCGGCSSISELGVVDRSLFDVSVSSRPLSLLSYRADGICAGSLGG
jgi:hypothetical protein